MARKVKPETRAKRMAETAPASKYDQAYQLALNIVFMEERLDETRAFIADEPVAVEYDNGGGQTGIRENPKYKGYENLLKSYQAVLKQFDELLGGQADEKAKSALAAHRAQFAVVRAQKAG